MSVLSAVGQLFRPFLLTAQQDNSPVVIKVFRESGTGMACGVADSGDVRPLMLVEEPPLFNLGGRVLAGASASERKEVRRRLALEAPPLVDSQLLEIALEDHLMDEGAAADQTETAHLHSQNGNGNGNGTGNGRPSHNGAGRVLVPSHD